MSEREPDQEPQPENEDDTDVAQEIEEDPSTAGSDEPGEELIGG
jgi:hypothetical protein